MKKILLATVATVCLSMSMSASTISQLLTQSNGGGNGSNVLMFSTFSALTGGNATLTLTGTTVDYALDYSLIISGTPTITQSVTGLWNVSVSGGSAGTYAAATPFFSALISGGAATAEPQINLGVNGTPASFTYASSVSGGQVGNTNGAFYVTYSYNFPSSGVPEPSTVALIGAGLVGIASIARRRR